MPGISFSISFRFSTVLVGLLPIGTVQGHVNILLVYGAHSPVFIGVCRFTGEGVTSNASWNRSHGRVIHPPSNGQAVYPPGHQTWTTQPLSGHHTCIPGTPTGHHTFDPHRTSYLGPHPHPQASDQGTPPFSDIW